MKNENAARLKYPIQEMNIGDSFLEPDTTTRHRIHSVVRNYNKKRSRGNWIGIKTKKENGGLRIWRLY